MFAAGAGTARAQLEEIEPRTVGGRGATFVGMSGFVDRFSSPEEALPLNYTAQVDVCRFITNKFAIRSAPSAVEASAVTTRTSS